MGCADFMQPRQRYGIGSVEEEEVAVVPISGALLAEIVSGRLCEARANIERRKIAKRRRKRIKIWNVSNRRSELWRR